MGFVHLDIEAGKNGKRKTPLQGLIITGLVAHKEDCDTYPPDFLQNFPMVYNDAKQNFGQQ